MKDKTQSIFCIDLSDKKKYIRGLSKEAVDLLFSFSLIDIFIEGFIEEQLTLKKYFHKPIYAEEEVVRRGGVILEPSQFEIKDIIKLNTEINVNNIVIYGAGKVGRELNTYFKEVGICIKAFMETKPLPDQEIIDGTKLYGKEMLNDFAGDTSIIVAGKYWEEIVDDVYKTRKDLKLFYIENDSMLKAIYRKSFDNSELNWFPLSIMYLEEHFPDKRKILYGCDESRLKKYNRIYNLLDYEEVLIGNEKIILDIYKSDSDIILVEDDRSARGLEEYGLKEIEDYVLITHPNIDYHFNKKFIYDINLGHIYGAKRGKPEIFVIGRNNEKDLRVLILGNSTSEPERNIFKSWPEILYQKYLKYAENITIYNCAERGYTSTQELIRLLRDGIHLNPSLIISYSGVCDVIYERYHGKSVFAFPNLCKVFHGIATNLVWEGEANGNSVIENWLFNIRCMNAIAQVNNSDFISFIQPMLISKKNLTNHEKELLKMGEALYPKEVFNAATLFRQIESDKGESYIINLSSIFDNINSSVYMDIMHVYEKGNEVVANEVWKYIKNKVFNHSRV